MTSDADATAARRAAIEEELRQRLARDHARPADTGAEPALTLQCLGCQHMNATEARFCTTCGARFNVRLLRSPGAGERR